MSNKKKMLYTLVYLILMVSFFVCLHLELYRLAVGVIVGFAMFGVWSIVTPVFRVWYYQMRLLSHIEEQTEFIDDEDMWWFHVLGNIYQYAYLYNTPAYFVYLKFKKRFPNSSGCYDTLRAYNALRRARVNTIPEAVSYMRKNNGNLVGVRNAGKQTEKEIMDKLRSLNLL